MIVNHSQQYNRYQTLSRGIKRVQLQRYIYNEFDGVMGKYSICFDSRN